MNVHEINNCLKDSLNKYFMADKICLASIRIISYLLAVSLWTCDTLRDKQCTICLRLQKKAFEIQKFPRTAYTTVKCSFFKF